MGAHSSGAPLRHICIPPTDTERPQDDLAHRSRAIRAGAFAETTVLLACGLLSSLLYVATDVLGGIRYDGYSFTSQAVSELMAIGTPSETFVDPLFITYGMLALAVGSSFHAILAATAKARVTLSTR